jgi:hypothetical protein
MRALLRLIDRPTSESPRSVFPRPNESTGDLVTKRIVVQVGRTELVVRRTTGHAPPQTPAEKKWISGPNAN